MLGAQCQNACWQCLLDAMAELCSVRCAQNATKGDVNIIPQGVQFALTPVSSHTCPPASVHAHATRAAFNNGSMHACPIGASLGAPGRICRGSDWQASTTNLQGWCTTLRMRAARMPRCNWSSQVLLGASQML